MVSLITVSTVSKRFKIQLLAESLIASVYHTLLRFLNLSIGYLLTTALILKFVASLIVRYYYTNLIILVLCSAFDLIFISFVLPILAHYYYHTSRKNRKVFVHFHMLHLICEITYLTMYSYCTTPICSLEKI